MVLGKVTAFDRLNEIANSKNEHEQCNGVRGGEKSMKDWALLPPVAGLRWTIAALYDWLQQCPARSIFASGQNDKDFFTF